MVCFKFVTNRCLSFSRLLSSASTTFFLSSRFEASVFLDCARLSLSSLCVFRASSSFSRNSSVSLFTFSMAAFASCFAARTLCIASVCFAATRSASNRDLAPASVCASAYCSISSFLRFCFLANFCSFSSSSFFFFLLLLFFFFFFSDPSSSSSSSSSKSSRNSPTRFFIKQFLNSESVIASVGASNVFKICALSFGRMLLFVVVLFSSFKVFVVVSPSSFFVPGADRSLSSSSSSSSRRRRANKAFSSKSLSSFLSCGRERFNVGFNDDVILSHVSRVLFFE